MDFLLKEDGDQLLQEDGDNIFIAEYVEPFLPEPPRLVQQAVMRASHW